MTIIMKHSVTLNGVLRACFFHFDDAIDWAKTKSKGDSCLYVIHTRGQMDPAGYFYRGEPIEKAKAEAVRRLHTEG